MKDIRIIIAKNIAALRTDAGMTQLKLAEVLSYSDKAVSKWERGEALPDVVVLKSIADYFGVSVDYLLAEEHDQAVTPRAQIKRRRQNRLAMSAISLVLVWLVATLVFATLMIVGSAIPTYLIYIYALPTSFVLILVLNCVWGNRRFNYLIVTFLLWTAVLSVYLTVLSFGHNLWILFLVAALLQAVFLFVPGISLIRRVGSKSEVSGE